jgi:DHA1 family bicyclomycin/chloramphenicol resistance-like MFS transporter
MSVFVDGTARPMVAGIAVAAIVALGLTRMTLGGRRGGVPISDAA